MERHRGLMFIGLMCLGLDAYLGVGVLITSVVYEWSLQ